MTSPASTSSRRRSSLVHALRAWSIPGVICLGAAVAALLGKDAYKFYTGEDGLTETLQVVFFTLAAFHALRAQGRAARRRSRTLALAYLAAFLGLVFLVGEELSWGQRFFGWGTPAGLADIHRQDETNLHNIEGVHQAFKWVQLLAGLYGTLLPRLLRSGALLGRWRNTLSFYVPAERLVPYFAPMLVWRIYRNLFPLPTQHAFAIVEFNEVLELVLAIGLYLFFRACDRELADLPRTDAGGALDRVPS